MIKRDELAGLINDSEYPLSLSESVLRLANENGFLIIYGASDDLFEVDGCIRDEGDCYDGGTFQIDKKGLLPNRDNIDSDDELEEFFSRKKTALKIDAVWARDDVSWTYDTEIPHSTFRILEDGDVCCVGMVISVDDLPVPNI